MSGLLNHPPERVIQQLLVDLGDVTDPNSDLAWPAHVDNMPDDPDNNVAVIGTEGTAEGREMIGGHLFEKYGIQIRVRAINVEDGYTKIAAIMQSLNEDTNLTDVTVADEVGTATSTYEVQSVMPTSTIIRLGPEPNVSRRSVWVSNHLASLRLTS
jgi:hypothetical protein